MAEMLFRVQDKVNADFYADCQCTKRADVIVVNPDNWTWGTAELTDPRYRIIRVFGYPVSAAQSYCAPELDADPQNPSKTLQKRALKLDLSAAAWPANFGPWLADDTRATAILSIVFASVLQQMELLKILKPPIQDPAVIGESPTVIG